MTTSVMEEGHIYVLGFSDKTVKVGRTTDPEGRIQTHRMTAGRGVGLVQSWVSEQHGDSNRTEAKLIEFCRERGRKHRGKEWFSGVSYKTVLNYAQGLELAPPQMCSYCGKHVISAGGPYPRRCDIEGFLRADLGLVLPPQMEMVFPGEEEFCSADQMDEVQKLLTRHLTAKADAEFLLRMALHAWQVLKEIETEIQEGARGE